MSVIDTSLWKALTTCITAQIFLHFTWRVYLLNVNNSVSFYINVHFSDHFSNIKTVSKGILEQLQTEKQFKLSPLHILPSLSISSPQKPHGCSKANRSDLNTWSHRRWFLFTYKANRVHNVLSLLNKQNLISRLLHLAKERSGWPSWFDYAHSNSTSRRPHTRAVDNVVNFRLFTEQWLLPSSYPKDVLQTAAEFSMVFFSWMPASAVYNAFIHVGQYPVTSNIIVFMNASLYHHVIVKDNP